MVRLYRVLRHVGDDGWQNVREVSAHSAEAAVRQIAEDGAFIAVPARHWKALIVRTRQETRVEVSAE